MTNIDTEREAFEKWAWDQEYCLDTFTDSGEYVENETIHAWGAWLAHAEAKSSRVSELPGWIDVAMTEDQLDVVIWAWNKARFPKEQDRHQAEFDHFIASSLARAKAGGGVDGWQDIATAPDDGTPHVRGLHVYDPDGKYLYWEEVAGHIDTEDGQFYSQGDLCGWEAEDFTYWHPLTEAPSPPEE